MYSLFIKRLAGCFILGISAILVGCDLPNSIKPVQPRYLGAITVNRLYVEKFDYYIYTYDSLDASPHSHYYENYTPKHDSLLIETSPYKRPVHVEIKEATATSRYVSYVFKFSTSTDKRNCHFDDSFYLDIYDCETPYCRNASQVVFRTHDYSYMEVFTKGEFTITEPSYKKLLGGNNTDGCTLEVNKNYRLVMKNERIDMDIEFQDTFFLCGG
jgi:hypothetical protein